MDGLNEKQELAAIRIRGIMMVISLILNIGLSLLIGIAILNAFKFDWNNIILGIFIAGIICTVLHFILKPILRIIFRFIEIPIMGIVISSLENKNGGI